MNGRRDRHRRLTALEAGRGTDPAVIRDAAEFARRMERLAAALDAESRPPLSDADQAATLAIVRAAPAPLQSPTATEGATP